MRVKLAVLALAWLGIAFSVNSHKHSNNHVKNHVKVKTPNGDCPDGPTKVTNLPFWNTSDTLPCMYSGFIKSSPTLNHNLFYWLFKNQEIDNPSLVLWLNGGPGSSSMFGLFTENGPIRVARNGTSVNDFTVGLSKEGSWMDEADVIFLDQPVQVGFSYGDGYATTMQQISDEMVNFLVSFIYVEYPEYKGRDLIITGESYAGKYLPQLATSIHKYNIKQATQTSP